MPPKISKEWTCNNCGRVVTRNPNFAEEIMPVHRKHGKNDINDTGCRDAEFAVVEVEIKTSHDWEHLELDAGHMGGYEIYRCRRCAATNNYAPAPPGHDSFWACGCGTDVNHGVSEDCDIAKAAIVRHIPVCRCAKCTCGSSKDAHSDKVIYHKGTSRTIREINGACANYTIETDLSKL